MAYAEEHLTSDDLDFLIPLTEAARLVGVTQATVYRWAGLGELQTVRVAGRTLTTPELARAAAAVMEARAPHAPRLGRFAAAREAPAPV